MHFEGMFRVKPETKLRLNHIDPAYKGEHESAETARQETEHFREKLAHQQILLYAQRKHSVLVVLQALDAGGKDGTVRHVFSALNPQGTTVVGFKQPTPIVSGAAYRRNARFPRNARSGRRPGMFHPMRRCPCAARTVFSGSARVAREPRE